MRHILAVDGDYFAKGLQYAMIHFNAAIKKILMQEVYKP